MSDDLLNNIKKMRILLTETMNILKRFIHTIKITLETFNELGYKVNFDDVMEMCELFKIELSKLELENEILVK